MARRLAIAAVLGLGLALAGCAPATTLRSARIVQPGKIELLAAAGVLVLPGYDMLTGGDGGGDLVADKPLTLPQSVLGLRVGLNEHLDLGARASFIGAELEVGAGLEAGRFAFSAAPSAGVRWTTDRDHAFHVQLPLLVGVGFVPSDPKRAELTVGLVGRYETEWGSIRRSGFFAGASVGLTVFVSQAVFLRGEFLHFWPFPLVAELRSSNFGAHDYFHTTVENGALAIGWLY